MKPIKPSKSRSGLLLVFLLLAAGIAATGIFHYRNYERQFRAEAEQQLAAIADLKVSQIADWRRERLADANVALLTPYVARRALDALADNTPTTRRMFTDWLSSQFASGAYAQGFLLDERLNVGLAYPERTSAVLGEVALRAAQQALRSRQVVVADLHRETADGPVYLSLMVPFVVRRERLGEKVQPAGKGSSPADRSAGLLVLQIDARKELYPLIQRWPTPSRTAETLLIRREGNEAVFLNELRFQTNTALTLRSSLANTNMPAVKAALGQEGIVEGRDYRGVPALAALRAVPDSPWFLVARRDVAEVHAPLRAHLWQVIVLVGVLIFGAGAGVGLLWRQHHVRFYQEKAATAEALQRSQALLTQAEKLGRVGGWEIDMQTRQLTWTETVYDIHELDGTGRPTVDPSINYYTPASRPIIERAVQRAIEQGEPFDVGLEIITAKGNRRSVHVVGKADRARRKVSGFFQDITERKQAEAERQKFAMLADSSSEFIGMCDLDMKPLYVNPAGLLMVGLPDLAAACQVKVPDYFFPEDQRFIAEEFFPRVLREGHGDVEIRLRHFQTGEPIWMFYYLFSVCDASGEIVGWATVSRDITTRRQADEDLRQSRQAALNLMTDAIAARERSEQMSQALQESEGRFRRAVVDSPFPILLHAEDGAILQASNSWCAITGYTREELATIGDWTERAYGDRKPLVQAEIEALYGLDHQKYEGDHTIRTKSGGMRIWEFSSAPLGRLPDGRRIVISMAMDVTERRLAEAATTREQALSKTIIDSIPGTFYMLDEAGRYVRWNAYQRDELIGQPEERVASVSAAETIHPEDRAFIQSKIANVLAQGRDETVEGRVLLRGGPAYRWLLMTGRRIMIEGRPFLVGIGIDITARKQAEREVQALLAAVQQEKTRLSALIGSIADEIWFADTQGRFTLANQPAQQEFRLARNEPIEVAKLASQLEVLRADGSPRPVEEAPPLRALAGEVVKNQEEIVRTPSSGELRYRMVSAAPVRDPAGSIIGSVSVVRDVTEQKRAEVALEQSNERLSLATVAGGVGIWDWDVINNKLTWDAQMFRLYGITTDDFSGAYEAWKAGVHPEDAARADAEVQLALRGEKEFDTEFRVVWLNGTIRHLAARAKMQRDAAGQPTKLIGTSHDITARQQAEAEIRELNRSLEQRVQERTAELLAANQELNAFAYAVSHDLRQPLRAMNGFSQALVEDFGATLPGAAHEFLNHIIQGSRRMGELIDGLLRLSRTTRGELRRDAVDLSALAARLLGELAAAEPNRRVTWTVAPGLTARGDERMIEVVLANLLDNAWKYTAKTPQPKIEFGAMEHPSSAVVGKGQDSGAAPSQPAPVFFVRDNGAGFDMQHAAKLFQPFQRLHREDEFPGIGIGLATVQRIVHRHGGAIQATVTPRQGTTFSFSLSAADLTVKDKYESKDHPSGGGHAPG